MGSIYSCKETIIKPEISHTNCPASLISPFTTLYTEIIFQLSNGSLCVVQQNLRYVL